MVSLLMVISHLVKKEKLILKDFFKNSDELANFIDEILDKYDDHASIYYTGNICRYFKN